MRRDILRIGIGRFLLEGALGVGLVQAAGEQDRVLAMLLAIAAALIAHFAAGKGLRRAFVAAHLALAGAAIPLHLDMRLRVPLLAAALGAAIELVHLDLLERQRLRESASTLRMPSSLWVRRLGSAVIIAGIGEATIPLAAGAAHPSGLAPLLVVLGAIAILAAGIGAGPGRPVTRPIDAVIFVLLSIALALPA